MRCLTVRQPYAYWIAEGEKRVENRSRHIWRKVIGQRIGIASSSHLHQTACKGADLVAPESSRVLKDQGKFVLGALVCTVVVDRVIQHGDADPLNRDLWRTGDRYALVLRDVVKLNRPVLVTGRLGLWPFPESLQPFLEDQ